ncbi:MAG: hypothetical protein ACRDYA_24460 [Egibacteraceae bacterium]
MLVRTRSRWLTVATLLILVFALAATTLPAVPATATPIDLGEALAVPTTATPIDLGRVRSSQWTLGGQPCRLIGLPAASPAGPLPIAGQVGGGGCEGVRPGAVVKTDNGQCSFNAMFIGTDKKTRKKTRYMGTAGHCVLLQGDARETVVTPPPVERIWAGMGPVAKDINGKRVGEFAYAVLADPKDFALIRLDDGVAANPQMCHWGGPTDINSDITGDLVTLREYGQGVGISLVAPARTLYATGMPNPDHVFADGVVLPGDSGSLVTSADGRAVGVTVTVGANTGPLGSLDNGTVGITRFQPQIDRAEQALDQDLELVTAPRLR